MFNRQEQIVLLLLAGVLLSGALLAVVDYYQPSAMAEFQVVPAAVSFPPVAEQVTDEPSAQLDIVTPRETDVELNTATAADLQTLPGIGVKTAERILEYRGQHGPFSSLEELRRVPGIGPRTIERIRSRVILADQ